ncbi:MAG: YggS family pyridoxal phosphate enzyme [Actinomycetes bacterium]
MNSEGLPVDPVLVEQIQERAAALRARWQERTDREVRLVCVTKAHGPEVAAAALAAGLQDLGENYAQELAAKAALLALHPPAGTEPRWHFIGQLQRNKVRLVAPHAAWWHTLDRAPLVDEVARRAPGARVLVQLDLAGAAGRGGCDPTDAPALVARARDAGLEVLGLMGVAPPGPPESARAGFRLLVEIADDLGLPERSIGMSGDADVAVEEGATVVRVGAALVGPRPAVRRGPE